MTIIVQIDGREAVPVRAIPFVVGWLALTPDVLAKRLAQASGFVEWTDRLHAHRFVSNGQHVEMLAKEWDRVVAALDALEERLKISHVGERVAYDAWQRESPTLLPAGCFVWRDEFEQVVAREQFPQVRKGDGQLDFSPWILADSVAMVMEGFEQIAEAREKELDPRERTTLLLIVGALAGEAKINLGRHYTAAEAVSRLLQLKSVDVSPRAISVHLKAAREAMEEARRKE